MSSPSNSMQTASAAQSEEIAARATDICRNPDFRADMGIDTHVVIFPTSVGQLRIGTLVDPSVNDGAVDCIITTREYIEGDETSQLLLQTDFMFIASGILRQKFSAGVDRRYYTLAHDAVKLVAVSNPPIVSYSASRAERKQQQTKKKEIDKLSAAVLPKEFLVNDYEKLKRALGEFSIVSVILSGDEASFVQLPIDRKWQ